MSQRVRGSAGTLHSGCDKTSLVHGAQGSLTWKESHVPSWARDMFFLLVFDVPHRKSKPRSQHEVEFAQQVSTIPPRKCLRHFTQRRLRGGRRRDKKKKKGVWAQRERQSKLLTGSHGNREETDKGLPKKAGRITTQNTFPFESCKVLVFAVAPPACVR